MANDTFLVAMIFCRFLPFLFFFNICYFFLLPSLSFTHIFCLFLFPSVHLVIASIYHCTQYEVHTMNIEQNMYNIFLYFLLYISFSLSLLSVFVSVSSLCISGALHAIFSQYTYKAYSTGFTSSLSVTVTEFKYYWARQQTSERLSEWVRAYIYFLFQTETQMCVYVCASVGVLLHRMDFGMLGMKINTPPLYCVMYVLYYTVVCMKYAALRVSFACCLSLSLSRSLSFSLIHSVSIYREC